MTEILQRLSRDNLEELRERLQEINGAIEDSDLEKPNKIQTRPQIFDMTTKVAPSSKMKRGV